MKKCSAIMMILPALFLCLICAAKGHGAGNTKIITDMDDRKIEVPSEPGRIACMHGVSSERIFTLGKGDRLVLMMHPTPWAYRLFPEIRNLKRVEPPFTGNIERMLNLKVDLVLYSPYPGEAEKYRAAGIYSACGFSASKRPRSMKEFLENFKRQYRFFGDLLGGDARTRAEKYCRYFDRKMSRIMAITSKIPMKERPAVYYGGRSGNLLWTQGNASVLHWFVEAAGGDYLPRAIDNNFAEVGMEKVLSWNPDCILVSGWGTKPDIVKSNPAWATMKAVKKGSVNFIPQGIFAWEYASGESVSWPYTWPRYSIPVFSGLGHEKGNDGLLFRGLWKKNNSWRRRAHS